MKATLLIALLLGSATAFAGSPPAPDNGGMTMVPIGKPENTAFACVPGNPFVSSYGGYLSNYTGNESYAMLLDPTACPGCDLGSVLSKVYVTLRLEAGASFESSYDLAAAVDLGGGCYSPGEILVSLPGERSPVVPSTAGWTLITDWDTGCLEPGQPYFLIVNLVGIDAGVIGTYYGAESPTPCRVWHNDGSGWQDAASLGFPGDMFFWADSDCCSDPVGTEDQSWGSLKSLFR